jgi:hypothetical protein
MTVSLVESDRQFHAITWDTDKVKGEQVEIRFENPDDPDNPSWTRALSSDGQAVISFPAGYSGTVNVTVAGDEGSADSGSITV